MEESHSLNLSISEIGIGDDVDIPSFTYRFLLVFLGVPFCIITVGGNLLVILSWFFAPNLRVPQNVLLVALALVDMIIGLTSIPLGFIYIYHRQWIFGDHTLPLCQFSLVCDYGLMFLSSGHLVLIALDRYRVLFEGVAYIHGRRVWSLLKSVIILWLIALLAVSPIFLDWPNVAKDPELKKHCIVKKTMTWAILTNLLDIILPMILLWTMYSRIFTEIKRRCQNKYGKDIPPKEVSSSDPQSDQHSQQSKEICSSKCSLNGDNLHAVEANPKSGLWIQLERKAMRTLGIVIGAFFVCWSPYLLCSMIDLFFEGLLPGTIFYYLALLGYANSCCNPFIYAIRIPEFRSAFKDLFQPLLRLFRCSSSSM